MNDGRIVHEEGLQRLHEVDMRAARLEELCAGCEIAPLDFQKIEIGAVEAAARRC